MQQGLCVFDEHKRLVFCNQHYADLYALPPELIKPTTPLIDILKHRVATGSFAGNPEQYISSRMNLISATGRREEILEQNDGRTIRIFFYPLTGGGWIATHEEFLAGEQWAEATAAERRVG
jgi:hypothetical protein